MPQPRTAPDLSLQLALAEDEISYSGESGGGRN